MPGIEPSLAAEFAAATREDWRAQVAAVLRKSGVPSTGGYAPTAAGDPADPNPEEALSTALLDGPEVKPLYTAADVDVPPTGYPGAYPYVRGATASRAGWDVRVQHADPDAAHTNAAVLADLTNGATSLWLRIGESGVAVDDLAAALDGVYLDLAPIVLDAGAHTERAVQALLALSEHRGIAPAELSGSLGADPIGLRARTGAAADLALLPALAEQAKGAPNLLVATVDGTVYHDGGASDADELAIATAVGVAYLRALTEAGLSVDAALGLIEFRFAVTDDQFTSIAKLRAARRLWGRVAELSGAAPTRRGQRQHAVTSAAMMTQRDPWVNMLRTTIACFAAAVGGADAITVLPFDNAIGLPDDFARRIARNTQSILHDESSLARVIDPGGGSWYVESLTHELALQAWSTFTAIERNGGAPGAGGVAAGGGGALALLDDTRIPRMVTAVRERRQDEIAHRRSPITGVSEFAFLEEQPVRRPAAPQPAGTGPVAPHRYAEQFEALRDRAESAESRPSVFLAALGPVAVHSARAGFAANLFAAGGIGSVTGTGTVDEITTAFADSGCALACICSSDKLYAESAAELAAALKGAGASQVWLAGKSDVPGVDATIFAGCDALAALRAAYDVVEANA